MLRGLVEADFDRIVQARRKLDELTGTLSNVNRTGVSNHIEEIQNIWKDSAGDIFVKKERELSGKMEDEMKVMERLVDDIGSTSMRLYRAEMEGRSLSSSRTY